MANKIISDLESIIELLGDMLLPVEDGSGTFAASIQDIKNFVLAGGAQDKILTWQSGLPVWAAPALGRNMLINGSFVLDQRNIGASTAIADDAYCFDGWYILTQTASVNVSQQTLQENGIPTNIRITQNQASAQRFGLAQIIEAKNAQAARAKALTLMKRVRISNSQALRYAILEWTGTEDSVTSDVVNDWTSSTYTGGNFFNSTTLNVLGVGSITPSAATWTDLTKLTANAGSSANNFIVFIWTEGTAAQNVTLDIAKAQLEIGSINTPFENKSYAAILQDCQRFCEKSYNENVALATVTDVGQALWTVTSGQAGCTFIEFQTKKAGNPSITVYSPIDGATGNLSQSPSTNRAATVTGIGRRGFNTYATSNFTATALAGCHWIAKYEL